MIGPYPEPSPYPEFQMCGDAHAASRHEGANGRKIGQGLAVAGKFIQCRQAAADLQRGQTEKGQGGTRDDRQAAPAPALQALCEEQERNAGWNNASNSCM